MNLPRYVWNENIRQDLLVFLKTSNDYKNSEFCSIEEYNQLKELFPLHKDMKDALQVYTEKENICITLTESDEEEIRKDDSLLKAPNNISLVALNCHDTNDSKDLIESIKDSLSIEKSISKEIINTLLNTDSINLAKIFCDLATELTLEDIQNLWNSITNSNITNEQIIQNYTKFLLLQKAKQEFTYEIQEIFLELSRLQGTILKMELIRVFTEAQHNDSETLNSLMQYVSLLENDYYKMEILSDFIYSAEKLHSNYIPVIEALLNPHIQADVLSKLIGIMAAAANDFCNDNAYGKLLFKAMSLSDKNLPILEQPLKHILGIHKSIWKIKVDKIVISWFNDTLSQSIM